MKTAIGQVVVQEKRVSVLSDSKYKIFLIFTCGYVFLSGFVFVEPSPAEIWFLLFLPLLLRHFVTSWSVTLSLFLLLLPLSLSAFAGALLGLFNLRFLIIDLYLFAFFFVLVSYIKTLSKQSINAQATIERLMRYWALAGAINLFFGFYALASGRTMILGTNVIRYGIRFTGFFKDPNVLGPFLVPVAVHYLIGWFGEKKSYPKFIYFLFFSLGTLLTFSRAAWLNYVVAITVVLAMKLSSRRTVIRSVWFLILSLLLFWIFWTVSDSVYVLGFNLKDFFSGRMRLQTYDIERFEAQRKFDEIMTSHGMLSILFGVGPGNYETFAGMSTHSLFARYLGERGIFGFCLFAVFIAMIWQRVVRSKNREFLIPVLLGQFANSLFIDSLHWRHLWLLFAISCT